MVKLHISGFGKFSKEKSLKRARRPMDFFNMENRFDVKAARLGRAYSFVYG